MVHAAYRPAFDRLVLGLALLVAPTLASAQSASLPGAMLTSEKSIAILGTASALDRLLAQQGAPAQPVATPTIARPDVVAPPLYQSADRPAFAIARGPIASDRPDVFNSVALPIGRTPLEARWHRVEFGAPDAPASRFATTLQARDAMRRLEAVNLYVNSRVRFVEDRVQYGVEDRWSPAAETLSRGRGDCEDFAIAKLAMLRRAGFAERDLYLVIARDLVRRQDHAIAVARANGRLWVLDSGTDQLLDSADVQDYRPVMTFSGARSWTHGYRRETPPMVLAAAPVAQPVPAFAPALPFAPAAAFAPARAAAAVMLSMPVQLASLELPVFTATWPFAGDDQRSRSASLFAFSTGLSR